MLLQLRSSFHSGQGETTKYKWNHTLLCDKFNADMFAAASHILVDTHMPRDYQYPEKRPI